MKNSSISGQDINYVFREAKKNMGFIPFLQGEWADWMRLVISFWGVYIIPKNAMKKFISHGFLAGRFLEIFLSKKPSSKKVSPLFKYCRGVHEVQRYLLASIGFWMNQFGMDGFRFLDVASMIYLDRGRWDVFFSLDGGCGWVVGGKIVFFFISGFEI